MQNSTQISQTESLKEVCEEVPVLKGYADQWINSLGFTDSAALQNSVLSCPRPGGGYVQAAYVFDNAMHANSRIKISLMGSNDQINWITIHQNLQLLDGVCYPISNRNSLDGRAIDLPVRYLWWAWKVEEFPADAPSDTIVILSSIVRNDPMVFGTT